MERVYAQYPLNFANEEIRLLNILPGVWDEPVRVQFSIASLCRETPQYATLSYVWGDTSKARSCIVEGQEFHITNNLHSALRRLRDEARPDGAALVIWADALCINQAVTEERNQQVRLMGKIYSKCCHVFVWLGELPGPGDDGARHASDEDHAPCSFGGGYPTTRAISMACEEVLLQLAAGRHMTDVFSFKSERTSFQVDAIYHAFSYLEANPWFTRRWVLQEAVLAPYVQVVFGAVSIRLDNLSRAMATIASHTAELCCLSSLPGHYNLRQAIRGFLQNFIPVERLRHLRGSRVSIMDLCLEFLDGRVSEEHDRIYALLGLVNPPSQLIPDYRSPVHTLFTDVSANHLADSYSSSVLHLAGLDRETAGLPSWVIDWKAVGSGTMKTWHQVSELFQTSGAATQTPIVDPDRRLRLLGWEVDQVAAVSETIGFIWQPTDGSQDAFGQDLNFQLWRSYIGKEHAWDDPYPSGGTWAMAWWRILCADSCWGANAARRLTQHDVDFFSSTLSRHTKSAGIGDGSPAPYMDSDLFELDDGRKVPAEAHYNDIMGMSASLLDGMRFFCTRRGYLGLARGPALVGDQVFILPGCRTPMLLRVRRSMGAIHEDLKRLPYSVVSFCYLHGVMDGEQAGEEAALEAITVV